MIFAVWAIAAAAVDSEFIMPDIGETFRALGGLFSRRSFWLGLCGTLLRSFISYAISVALFFLLFFAATAFSGAERIITPLVSALRTLPSMAVALVLGIWCGANATPVILGVTVIMPQMYTAAMGHNACIERELTEVCDICGANRRQKFFALTLPHAASALPETMSGALSFTVKIVIAAEILMQTSAALGTLMSLAETYLMTAQLFAMTFAAVVVSVGLEFALKRILCAALKNYR